MQKDSFRQGVYKEGFDEKVIFHLSSSLLDRTLLASACLHFVPQDQTCLLFWVFFDFLLLHSNPI